MTDRKTLDLLRKEAEVWAGDMARLGTEGTMPHIAAEFILSLPDTIVDGDELREWIGSTILEGRPLRETMLGQRLESFLPVSEPASPRPEDVPVGEVWKVEVDGNTAIGFRNEPWERWPWCVTYQVHPHTVWLGDNDVTLIARLVPETTEQDEEPEFGPAYIYTDRDGDEWECIDGKWVAGDTHAKRAAKRILSYGQDVLPAEFGPYPRIEKENDHDQ